MNVSEHGYAAENVVPTSQRITRCRREAAVGYHQERLRGERQAAGGRLTGETEVRFAPAGLHGVV